MRTLLLVFGTRPEAIKLCPLVLALREQEEHFRTVVCVSAQHREMLDQVLSVFGVRPDVDLDLMTPGQSLSQITSRAVEGISNVARSLRPDLVIVQGDTTTTFAAALGAYYERIPVAHVEAGLRTGNKYSPFPEEINRRMTGTIAELHFAATEGARNNLVHEGVPRHRITVTGNTVIDALLWVRDKTRNTEKAWPELNGIDFSRRVVLVTGHRRENFGARFDSVCAALKTIALENPDVELVYPVHRNPNVTGVVFPMLAGIPNVHLIDPLSYEPFVVLMDRSYCIITDSGGIQEEAPALGKPVLVTRDTTERPEAVAAGTARLVGADTDLIVRETQMLLHNEEFYRSMATASNPFGDGRACARIVDAIKDYFGAEAHNA